MPTAMQLQVLLVCFLLSAATFSDAQLDTSDTDSEGEGGGAADTDSSKLTVGSVRPDINPILISRKRLSIPYSPGKSVKLTCNVNPPGKFKGWLRGKLVVSNQLQYKIPLSDNAYNKYLCIAVNPADPGKYQAMEFTVTEMPGDGDKVAVIPLKLNSKASMRCDMDSASGYDWFRYNDITYRFDKIDGENGRTLEILYDDLVRGHDPGFTFYKCQRKDSPSSPMEFFSLKKEPLLETDADKSSRRRYEISMRPVDSGVAAVPVRVLPQSRVSLECHKSIASDSAEWSFRSNATIAPSAYAKLNDSFDVKEESDVSVLSVKKCEVRNMGYYRCNIGGAVKYAFLELAVIVPSIHEYSKSVYDMDSAASVNNELECEIPLGGQVKDVVWRVVPPSGRGSSYDIGVNQKANGFETYVKEAAGSRLVVIKFMDSGLFKAYRLECRLGDMLDYVILKTDLPDEGLAISFKDFDSNDVKLVECNSANVTDIQFHVSGVNKDPIGVGIRFHEQKSPTKHQFYHTPTQPQHWYRCSGLNSKNVRIYSYPLPLFKTPMNLTITVDGAVVDSSKPQAKVAGTASDFMCKLQKPTDFEIDIKNVALERNGVRLSIKPDQVDGLNFRFRLDSPSPADSGLYQCRFISADPVKAVSSAKVRVNWCTTDEFMCDGDCKDKGVKCNGTRDCMDGTDELAVMCNDCEPNEVPCGSWNGVKPKRKCTLKHWLCDGQDDCENGFDEESPVAKSWCTKTCMEPSMTCPSNSTCCTSKKKCILRSYECDSEDDCSSRSDEENCCKLRMNRPTRNSQVKRSEGSNVTLTCEAVGKERPTINWRCNWGYLRDPDRMKESNEVTQVNSDGTYTVIGTLTIQNFTKADECIYNCEAVTKCKRELSPEIDLKGE